MEEGFFLPRVSLVITERCTLKCKLCAEYSPYFPKAAFTPLEELEKAIDMLFLCTDAVGDFSISGGEPLLHKEIYQVIRHLWKYEKRINRILVLTNGTVLPSEEDLAELVDAGITGKLQFNISDYGNGLSAKLASIVELCEKLGVKHRVITYHGKDLFCDGWIDYGDHTKKYFTEEEVKEHAEKCYFRKTVNTLLHTFDGRSYMSRCGRSFWRKFIGVTSEETTDVVSFPYEITQGNMKKLKKDIERIANAAYSDSCAYCNGMCEDAPRFQPAEQLTMAEVQRIQEELFGKKESHDLY